MPPCREDLRCPSGIGGNHAQNVARSVVGVVAGLVVAGLAGRGRRQRSRGGGQQRAQARRLPHLRARRGDRGRLLPAGRASSRPSGIEVVSAIYDTLVTINTKGQIVPLPRAVGDPRRHVHAVDDPAAPGDTFQNGEPLDAAAVKLNLDTYRGDNPNIARRSNPTRSRPITSVTVTGPLTSWSAPRAVARVALATCTARAAPGSSPRPSWPARHACNTRLDRHRPVRARGVAAQPGPDRDAQPALLAAGPARTSTRSSSTPVTEAATQLNGL